MPKTHTVATARRRPPVPPGPLFPSPQLLAGRLAAATVAKYTCDGRAYLRFCRSTNAAPLQAASLRRWRTHLVEETRLSPHTINRLLAAVKRVVQEGAVQGLVAREVATAFAQVEGVSVEALRHRLKAQARVRITPAQMRQLCEAPDPATLLGQHDRALLHTLAISRCRLAEVLGLTPTQLTTRDGACFVQVLGKRQRALRQAQHALGHKRLETTVQHYGLDALQPGLTEGLY